MSRYAFQLRRGVKDDTTGRDDWAEYEKNPNRIKPVVGELVLEYDNGIPRLKIGDGEHEFSELPYMSVDSFILPTSATVTIYPDKWLAVDVDGNFVEEVDGVLTNRYIQYVDVKNAVVTPTSKVDLQFKPEDLVVFHKKDLAFTAINQNGAVRVCVIGQKPTSSYTFNVTVTEIVEAGDIGEIVGNTTTTPVPQSDWSQGDEAKADYIKNKPDVDALIKRIEDLEAQVKALTEQ